MLIDLLSKKSSETLLRGLANVLLLSLEELKEHDYDLRLDLNDVEIVLILNLGTHFLLVEYTNLSDSFL